jgi:hypothetical protein
MILTGRKCSARGKTCPNSTSSTAFPTWTELGSNTVIRSEMSAINRLSCGTPLVCVNTGMMDVVSEFRIGVASFDYIYPFAYSTVWKLLVLVHS